MMIKAYAIAAVLTATSPVQTADKEVITAPVAPAQTTANQIVINTNEVSLRKWWGGRYGSR